MKSKYIFLILIFVAVSFSACKKQRENYFRKREEKKDTKVEGKVTFEDGTSAAYVYVNILQYLKTQEYNGGYQGSPRVGLYLMQQLQTDASGNYLVTFRAEKRQEGYERDFDDYYIYVTKTDVEEISYVGFPASNETIDVDIKNHGKINMRHKNNINIIIK